MSTTVAAVWIPLAAVLTPANAADNDIAPDLIRELLPEARYVLGDRSYNAPNVRHACESKNRELVASRHGAYPHTDAGADVRRLFHKLRSKGIFDAHGQVPTRGLIKTQRFALGAIFVYQLTLLYHFEHGLDLRIDLKALLKAA